MKGNERRVAWILAECLAWIHIRQDRYEVAKIELEEACSVFQQEADLFGLSRAMDHSGVLAQAQGNTEQSKFFLENALALAVQINHEMEIANVRNALGNLAFATQNYEDAWHQFEKAREIRERQRDLPHLASTLCRLGDVTRVMGHYTKARQLYTKSRDIAKDAHRTDLEPGIGQGLALLEEELGNLDTALLLAEEANRGFQRLGIEAKVEETRAMVERLEGKLSVD